MFLMVHFFRSSEKFSVTNSKRQGVKKIPLIASSLTMTMNFSALIIFKTAGWWKEKEVRFISVRGVKAAEYPAIESKLSTGFYKASAFRASPIRK